MKRIVKIRSSVSEDLAFGPRTVPRLGTLNLCYDEYVAIVKNYEVPQSGISVSVRDIKFQNVSVKDFGALGNGVVDDTYQVQNAIDYVSGNGGGVVNFPVGVYRVTHLNIVGNVLLVGESKNDSVIYCTVDGSTSEGGEVQSPIEFKDGENGMVRMKVVV